MTTVCPFCSLFFGASCARVYAKSQNKIIVKDDVRIATASRQESEDWLTFYARYGEKMSNLLELLYPKSDDTDVYDLMSNTLNGYLATLRQIVHQVARVIVEEGDQFLRQGQRKETGSEDVQLHSFRQFMKSPPVYALLKTIDFLHLAHNEVVKSDDFFYNYKCTPLIINVFHRHLSITGPQQDLTIAWNLFLAAVRPTLFYLDDMIDTGCSLDKHEEFMFDIGDVELRKDVSFWDDCLLLKDEQAVPVILKPLIDHLVRAIRSRLLLLGSGREVHRGKRMPATFDLFYAKWCELQSLPSGAGKSVSSADEGVENRSETPDSGEGEELDDNPDSKSTDNDVSQAVLASRATTTATSLESVDEGLGNGISCAVDFGPGQLSDLYSLQFPNLTPLDSTYFENKLESVPVYNPDLDHLPELKNELLYDLPGRLRTPFKLAIERSLYPAVIGRCDASSADLMTAFRDSYLRHLKFHTDYWLLHKDSHSISLYLDKLFQQITFKDSKHKMFIFQSYHFDDESDVRACVMYSHKPEDIDTPIKILNRLHIQYHDMECFSKLLLSPQIRQTLADAFHFLIILKYSKWLLCSVNLRYYLHQAKHSGDDQVSDRHALFCLRFRCLKAVTQLLEFVMFELHDGIVRLEKDAQTGRNFDQLRDSLTAFADLVKRTTLMDKNAKTLTDIVSSSAMKIQQMTVMTESMAEQVKRVEKIVSFLCYRSACL